MAADRYFHVSYQTRGAVGFKTFASDKFPSMDEIAKDAGVSPENIVVTSIFEFRSVDDKNPKRKPTRPNNEITPQ